MKNGKILRFVRRTLAIVLGAAMLGFFLDFLQLMPVQMHALFHIQIVPLVVSGAVLGLAVMVALTLLLGRWYCSMLCPLGILQDVIGRVKRGWARLRGKRRMLRMKYQRPLNVVRYAVLAAVAVPYALGNIQPLIWTDPYSNFGRIATSLFRPVAVGINNTLAGWLNAAGNTTLYAVQNPDTVAGTLFFAAVVLVALIVMVWLSGRLWCNTVCPVGTLLGLFSRFSWLRVRIGQGECNGCGQCEAACKARCIDSKARTVDASRCVSCFNCLGTCKQGAIAYVPGKPAAVSKVQVRPVAACQTPFSATRDALSAEGASRRRFLKGSLLALGTLPAARLMAAEMDGATVRTTPPMPPGAGNRARFASKCTACQLCVSACPTQVLRPAGLENGLAGFMQPYMRFRLESFCNFECRKCLEVCPTHALFPLTIEEKKLTRVGTAVFRKKHCVVYTKDQDCGACAEHCPTQAVHMIPYKDGLTIPKVEPQYCIGCGGCESICPSLPLAIRVYGEEDQTLADPPKKDDVEAGEITDFGF